ncbi:hypothetical protein B9Z55_021644 [Caenorhabditis nigoni]|uniref:Uncharacterized protein n=1 Tax=Caenorhabditis nigoni TaxID=1611254 RepID=A0A2G5TSZ0_9PELO|nr:hypothetical protein B9Z55_021644 [Caenorhabditis nigoni]
MPIRLLSLSTKDIKYTLNCMNVGDLIAFSLCSKNAKNLTKASNRKIWKIRARVFEDGVRLDLMARRYEEAKNWDQNEVYVILDTSSSVEMFRGYGIETWMEPEFTGTLWIAHLLSIFNESMIPVLKITGKCHMGFLNNFIFPKCQTLRFERECSKELIEQCVSKLSAEHVEVETSPFDVSKTLALNLKSLSLKPCFESLENRFEVKLEDLLALNIVDLRILAKITEKDINRFLKLWMMSNHQFYRPKSIELNLMERISEDRILRGIKFEILDGPRYGTLYGLKRADEKELKVSIRSVGIDRLVEIVLQFL